MPVLKRILELDPSVRFDGGAEVVTVEDGSLAWFLVRVSGRETCRGDAVLPGRGWHLRPALTASSGHPFGLVRRMVSGGAPGSERLAVRPSGTGLRGVALDLRAVGLQRRGAGSYRGAATDHPLAPAG